MEKAITGQMADERGWLHMCGICRTGRVLRDGVTLQLTWDGDYYRVDRNKYQIQIPLPPKIDASVTLMMVEEKPDVTYSDIGGCKEQIDKMREVVELPMLHPEKFVQLGIDPPKGVLCYGPPGGATVTWLFSWFNTAKRGGLCLVTCRRC